MNRELLSKAFGDIDESFIAQAYRPVPEDASGSSGRSIHMKKKRILTLALAAILLLSLGVAAYAKGWMAPIFHSARYAFPEPEERKPELEEYYAEAEEKNAAFEAAEQYMNERGPAPESVPLPELGDCEVTVLERYYNGNMLALGVHLETDIPDFAVVYEPVEDIRERATFLEFVDLQDSDDDLDALLAAGRLPRELYDRLLAERTDYAKKYGLHRQSSITLDGMLKNALPPEEYEAAWRLLLETGQLCVVRNNLYVSDHILMEDGTDLGETNNFPFSFDPSIPPGSLFIEAFDLPEAAWGLDSLNFQLIVRHVQTFYYMEGLDGPVRSYSERVGEALVPFCVENAEG